MALLGLGFILFSTSLVGGPGKRPEAKHRVTLFNPTAKEGSFTSPITGNSIGSKDILALAKRDCASLLVHIEASGVDVLLLNSQLAPRSLASLRTNEKFSQDELDAAATYGRGLVKTFLSVSEQSSAAQSASLLGFALDRNDHIQGLDEEGYAILLRRERPGRPLIALDAGREESELVHLAQHEFLHTRFFQLTHDRERKVGEQIHSLRDSLTLHRKETAFAVHAVLAKKGYSPNSPKIEFNLPEDSEWAAELAMATMQHDYARALLECIRSMDEFDVVSAQLEHRNQFGLSDAQTRFYLMYLVEHINSGRQELERQFGKPLVEYAIQHFGPAFQGEHFRQLELYKSYLPLFDRAELYARQPQFDRYIPELKTFPPAYSFLSGPPE